MSRPRDRRLLPLAPREHQLCNEVGLSERSLRAIHDRMQWPGAWSRRRCFFEIVTAIAHDRREQRQAKQTILAAAHEGAGAARANGPSVETAARLDRALDAVVHGKAAPAAVRTRRRDASPSGE